MPHPYTAEQVFERRAHIRVRLIQVMGFETQNSAAVVRVRVADALNTPIPLTGPAMHIILPMLGTVCLAVAALLTLLLSIETKAFTATPPQGANAMGLVVVFFGMGLRWILMFIAAMICLGRGSFDWISPRPGLPSVIVIATMIGLGVLFAASWIQWTYPARWYTPWLGNIGAFLVPLLAQVYLVMLIWTHGKAGMHAASRSAGMLMLVPALAGLAIGGFMMLKHSQRSMAHTRELVAKAEKEHAEHERRRALSRTDRLKEDLAAMPPASQFWQLAGYFDDCETAEQRQMVVQAIDRIVADKSQLGSNLTCPYASFRNRAAMYVICADSVPASVAPSLVRAIDLLTETISETRSLRGSDREDYPSYIHTLVAATHRLPQTSFDQPLTKLRIVIEALPDSDDRSRALASLSPTDGPLAPELGTTSPGARP